MLAINMYGIVKRISLSLISVESVESGICNSMYQSVLAEFYFIPTLSNCMLVTLPVVDVFLFEIWLSLAHFNSSLSLILS